MISILIADDENLIRNLFITSLSKYGDINIVGQAANGEEVMEILRVKQLDVLLLDLNMPRVSGIDVLNQLTAEAIKVNTLVISMIDDDAMIWEAINLGALGFLNKNEEWDEMHNAIKTVASGKFYKTDRIHSILFDMARKKQKVTLTSHKENFSDRELVIIRYLNQGLSSIEIAGKLYCSRANVDRIRQELIHRIGVRNTTELIVYAITHKLAEVDKA